MSAPPRTSAVTSRSGCSAGSTSIAPYSTSIWSSTCTTRIEKPQRGASGVPFMKSRTGLAAISSWTLDFSSGSAMAKRLASRADRLELGVEQARQRQQPGAHRHHDGNEALDHRVLHLVDSSTHLADPTAQLTNATIEVVEARIRPGRAH